MRLDEFQRRWMAIALERAIRQGQYDVEAALRRLYRNLDDDVSDIFAAAKRLAAGPESDDPSDVDVMATFRRPDPVDLQREAILDDALFEENAWTPERVRALRAQLGLSQQAFAVRVGCAQGAAAMWELGQRRPTGLYRAALARLERQTKRPS